MYVYRTFAILCLTSLAVSLGAPATYDQRQDGNVNVAAKLENVLILVAVPGGDSSVLADSDDLASYFDTSDGRNGVSSQVKGEEVVVEAPSSRTSEESSLAEYPKSGDEAVLTERRSSGNARGRQYWNYGEVSTKPREGTILKKELTVLSDDDDSRDYERANNHYQNEVTLTGQHHLTLIGTAIEDCGPERRRNSLGICQPAPED